MELGVIERRGISYEDTAKIWVGDLVSLDKDGGSGETEERQKQE